MRICRTALLPKIQVYGLPKVGRSASDVDLGCETHEDAQYYYFHHDSNIIDSGYYKILVFGYSLSGPLNVYFRINRTLKVANRERRGNQTYSKLVLISFLEI